jgi:TolB-like protein
VVDFTDLQGRVTEYGRFLAEEFSVALAANPTGFKVIDRTNIKTILQEHKLASTGIIDPQTARKLGEITGVQALVTGTVTPFGDDLRISVKVLDAETAEIIRGLSADMPRNKAIDELLARGVASGDQPATVPTEKVEAPKAQQPSESATAESGDLLFSIQRCRFNGDKVECLGTVTNRGSEEQKVSIDFGKSYLIDDLGKQSGGGLYGGKLVWKIGSNSYDDAARVDPNLPTSLYLSGKELSSDAKTVSIVLELRSPQGKCTLKNILLQAR